MASTIDFITSALPTKYFSHIKNSLDVCSYQKITWFMVLSELSDHNLFMENDKKHETKFRATPANDL